MTERRTNPEKFSVAGGLVVAAVLAAPACSGEPRVYRVRNEEITGAALNVSLSNQSRVEPRVDVRVELDGREVFAGRLRVDDQHTRTEVLVNLSEGAHRIAVTAGDRGPREERTFTADGDRWVVVNYWHDPGEAPYLTLDVQDRAFGFD